ncbi:MAG: hypothetical protein IE931_06980 [Sphingobacteriales bacterium]|nr:hypothetical protein [Sphingobacteriales bacterium]
MKTQATNNRIRAIKNIGFVFISLSLILSACKKNDKALSIDDEEAAEVMIASVDPSTGGVILNMETSNSIAVENASSLECGVVKDSTITKSGVSLNKSFNSTISWSRLLTCQNSVPQSFSFTFTGNSVFTSPRLTAQDTETGNLNVAGLQPSTTQTTITGDFNREGNKESAVLKQRSFSSILTGTCNVIIDKKTQKIKSGQINLNLQFESSSGTMLTKTGTLVFNGDNTATLTLSSGTEYKITW